jgi:hypothetical protein
VKGSVRKSTLGRMKKRSGIVRSVDYFDECLNYMDPFVPLDYKEFRNTEL